MVHFPWQNIKSSKASKGKSPNPIPLNPMKKSMTSPLHSKVTFLNLPPAQGYASPSRKLVLPQIDHNFTVGVIMYTAGIQYTYVKTASLLFYSYGARINQ